MKRVIDVLVAAAALSVLSPVLALVAMAIVLETGLPVLFRQVRIGLGGREFRMYKFRSMVRNAAAVGPYYTSAADPRITRVGAFIRRTSLDELPQLFNVLAGDMSLVGPRPDVPRYVDQWPADLRARVLAVRPGITDPASLAFRDEAALLARAADPEREYMDVILPRKLALAADYADHASLWTDLAVIGRSVGVLLFR
jgi:lipopolysaccharide/colanic/teichoic acid biosynthesis glycosyltransferase